MFIDSLYRRPVCSTHGWFVSTHIAERRMQFRPPEQLSMALHWQHAWGHAGSRMSYRHV